MTQTVKDSFWLYLNFCLDGQSFLVLQSPCFKRSQMTKLIEVSSIPTYPPTYLPTHLPAYLPTYLPTYPPTCLPTYLPTHLPTNLPTYWLLLFSSGRGLLAAPKQEVCILG